MINILTSQAAINNIRTMMAALMRVWVPVDKENGTNKLVITRKVKPIPGCLMKKIMAIIPKKVATTRIAGKKFLAIKGASKMTRI
jgi:hypothetical protein